MLRKGSAGGNRGGSQRYLGLSGDGEREDEGERDEIDLDRRLYLAGDLSLLAHKIWSVSRCHAHSISPVELHAA